MGTSHYNRGHAWPHRRGTDPTQPQRTRGCRRGPAKHPVRAASREGGGLGLAHYRRCKRWGRPCGGNLHKGFPEAVYISGKRKIQHLAILYYSESLLGRTAVQEYPAKRGAGFPPRRDTRLQAGGIIVDLGAATIARIAAEFNARLSRRGRKKRFDAPLPA